MIDVAVFDAEGTKLYFKSHQMDQSEVEFTFTVDHKPGEAVLDPYYKLIDREPGNNAKKVKKT